MGCVLVLILRNGMCIKHNTINLFVSATRRRRDIKIPLCLSNPVRKSLIEYVTSIDTCSSAIFSICKTNFTDHHTPNTIHSFRDSVLVCKMHECMIRQNFEHFHFFPSSDASDYTG